MQSFIKKKKIQWNQTRTLTNNLILPTENQFTGKIKLRVYTLKVSEVRNLRFLNKRCINKETFKIELEQSIKSC